MTTRQWKRKVTLIISRASGDGLDLSPLHIKFLTKKSENQTPNTAEIRVWNLAEDTANQIKKEFTDVVLQAGYEENYGVIFRGNLKQVKKGKENGTDTYVDLYVGDGDAAYNFAIVNKTLAAGSSQKDQVMAAMGPMQEKGVSAGYMPEMNEKKLPRGKVMYGMSKNYLRKSAENTQTNWSIQDGKLQFVPLREVLPDQVIVLNSKSGLIGTPEQTNEGITVKALINPQFKVGGKIKVDQKDIAEAKIDEGGKDKPANKPAKITDDGIYKILSIEYEGDNRGNDFYANIVCIGVDESAPKNKKAKKNG